MNSNFEINNNIRLQNKLIIELFDKRLNLYEVDKIVQKYLHTDKSIFDEIEIVQECLLNKCFFIDFVHQSIKYKITIFIDSIEMNYLKILEKSDLNKIFVKILTVIVL